MVAQQQSRFAVAYQQTGAAIKLPAQATLAFPADILLVNNQTAATIQVGTNSSGPFLQVRSYSYLPLPWRRQAFIYVQQVGSAVIQSSDYLEIDYQQLPFGQGAANGYTPVFSAPAGWGPNGPGTVLQDVHSGDQFHFGQVEQIVQYLRGTFAHAPVWDAVQNGIVDDSVTDNIPAINALIALASAHPSPLGGPGARIRFPYSTSGYGIGSTLQLPTGIIIEGEQGRSVQFKALPGFVAGTPMGQIGKGDGVLVFNSRFESVLFDCANIATEGVRLSEAQEECGLRNVIVASCVNSGVSNPATGIHITTNAAHWHIWDCEIFPARDTQAPPSPVVGLFYDSASGAGEIKRLSILPLVAGGDQMAAGVRITHTSAINGGPVLLEDIHVENAVDAVDFGQNAFGFLATLDITTTNVTNAVHIRSNAGTVVLTDIQGGNAVTATVLDDRYGLIDTSQNVPHWVSANPTQSTGTPALGNGITLIRSDGGNHLRLASNTRTYGVTAQPAGGSSALTVDDNTGVKRRLTLYSTGGFAVGSAPPADPGADNVAFQARITAPAVGVNASTLTHEVTVPTPSGVAASGTGAAGPVAVALTEITTAALDVELVVTFSSSVAGDGIQVTGQSGATNALISFFATAGRTNVQNGRLPLSGAARTVYYVVTGTGNWQLHIYPAAYAEPT